MLYCHRKISHLARLSILGFTTGSTTRKEDSAENTPYVDKYLTDAVLPHAALISDSAEPNVQRQGTRHSSSVRLDTIGEILTNTEGHLFVYLKKF